MQVLTCPYCGRAAVLHASSTHIYKVRDYGPVWQCPVCPNVYVTCHKGSSRPKGTMANSVLRAARKQAHLSFDPLWQGGELTRQGAYAWLRQIFKLQPEEAHIGLFNLEQCKRLIVLINQRNQGS